MTADSPSRSPALTVRERDPEDDPRLVAIRNEARPWLPPTSVEEYRWGADPKNLSPEDIVERWTVESDAEIVGLYVLAKMRIERENTFIGNIGVARSHRRRGIGSAMYDHLLQRATGNGATRLYGQVSADDDEAQTFFERRGFVKNGRANRMSRLIVEEANLDGYESIYQRLAGEGIVIKVLSEIGLDDEPAMRKIHELNFAAARDIPTSEEFSSFPFEDFMRYLTSPGNSPDQCWVAYDGDRPVGWASVSRRGDDSAFNNLTGVDREYRGKGIARAVKLKTIEWARENGVKTIFTANDYENKPMLAINIPLGYVEVPAELEIVKDL